MANLAFRAATDAFDTSFGTNVITGNVPAGTAAGDAQFVVVTGAAIAPTAAPTYSTPSGWTLLGSSSQFSLAAGLLNIRIWVFWRKAGSSEVNQAFTASANCAMGIVRSSYTNPDPNGYAGQVVFGSGSGTTVGVGPLTTTRLNSLLQAFVSQGTAQSITPAAGFTERVDNATSGISMADAIQAAIGASGTKNFTIPSSGDWVWAFIEGYSNNTVTNVESITFSDSQTGIAKFAGAIGETISLSDSQVAVADFIGASLESITFADATDGVFRQFGDLAETLSLSDAQDAVLVSGSIAQETISFADSVDGQQDALGAVNEAVLFSDSVAGAFVGIDVVGESITFADGQTAAFRASSVVGESISLSDSIASVAEFLGAQDEIIVFADLVDGIEPGQAEADEQITLLDSQTAAARFIANVTESITLIDVVSVAGDEPATGSPHGFVISDTAPSLWWQRKPKALDEQEAAEKVAKVVRVVERIARQQVEAETPSPAKEQKREVREAIAPLVAEMPGFDWMTLYRTILIELGRRQQEQQAEELAQMEIARIQAIRRDEDDVLLLLMSI
jgi:hypothetical protein